MYSKDLQEKVRASYAEHNCFRKVAKIFKMHHFTVKRIVENLHKPKPSQAGAPRKTTSRDESNIRRAAVKIAATGHRVTARKVRAECNLASVVGLRTMQTRLRDIGLRFEKADRRIVLSNAQKQARLEFVRKGLLDMEQFKRVIWTDEKRFKADGPDVWKSWMDPKNKIVRNRRQQGGPSLQVWGMLIPGNLLVVMELPPRGDSASFMQFMEEQVLPNIRAIVGDDFVLQQDNAPTHSSAFSTARFSELDVQLMPWPARSPDLNLIENCWSLISEIVYDGDQFANATDLWTAIDAAVTEINVNRQDALQAIFDSLPKRFLECVEKKGDLIDY